LSNAWGSAAAAADRPRYQSSADVDSASATRHFPGRKQERRLRRELRLTQGLQHRTGATSLPNRMNRDAACLQDDERFALFNGAVLRAVAGIVMTASGSRPAFDQAASVRPSHPQAPSEAGRCQGAGIPLALLEATEAVPHADLFRRESDCLRFLGVPRFLGSSVPRITRHAVTKRGVPPAQAPSLRFRGDSEDD
jgi:hypothetical protein